MHYTEAEFVGESGRLFGLISYNKPEVNRYLKFREDYKKKADWKTNPYDIVWSFIQSEKLRLKILKDKPFWDFLEHEYKEHEKWIKWRLEHLEIDDNRYNLFQQSKELTARIKNESDKEIIKELKETKKDLNQELKKVREELKDHFKEKPDYIIPEV